MIAPIGGQPEPLNSRLRRGIGHILPVGHRMLPDRQRPVQNDRMNWLLELQQLLRLLCDILDIRQFL